MSDIIGQITARYGFQPFSLGDAGLFEQYGTDTDFFDLSFTNFWTWGSHFHYVRKVLGGALVVFYEGVGGQIACILLPGQSRDLRQSLKEACEIFQELGHPAVFEYVPEEWLPLYREAGVPLLISSHRDWSDYIYEMSEFTALKGNQNKAKRRELSSFEALGKAEFIPLERENFHMALEVFDRWCGEYDCGGCVFGCERSAFARIAEIWNGQYYGGFACLDGVPEAFAIAETLGGCACYSFQKNARRLPGLTYFLHYHCALLPGHPARMNWCEDMGLEGLRQNKLKYHPCELQSKYQIVAAAKGSAAALEPVGNRSMIF